MEGIKTLDVETPEQSIIKRMILEVKEGRWCRNVMYDQGRRCAMGMAVTFSGAHYHNVVDALTRNIPQERLDFLHQYPEGAVINGGIHRGWFEGRGEGAAVATFNNTVESVNEILDWYQATLESLS